MARASRRSNWALRGESAFIQDWFIAAAASISQCLNIEITVNNLEFQDYMSRLLARPTTLQFGGVSYGMDYLDPANMMGVWVSTGRHSWRNEDFDNLVREANSFTGDPAERMAMYQEAERMLVEDVGGIFLVHRIQGDLWQPYMAATGNCWGARSSGLGDHALGQRALLGALLHLRRRAKLRDASRRLIAISWRNNAGAGVELAPLILPRIRLRPKA